ncbi:flavin reductase family protein [Nocardiopsis coralliicola]
MRTEYTPADLPGRDFYRMLTSVVVPRPIAWVSTLTAEGTANLAPHSFFTVASADPPTVLFTSMGRKDTLANIEATGEFTVNFAPERLQQQINATSAALPPEASEFDAAGLEREPGSAVAVPRVADSPVALECVLHTTVPVGGATVVFGRVVHVAVDTGVLTDGLPGIERLRPIARLGRNEWGALGEVTRLDRPPQHTAR